MQFEFKKSSDDEKVQREVRDLDRLVTKTSTSLKPNDTAWEAVQALAQQWADPLPVVDNLILVGIVTARSLITEVAAKGADPKQIHIRDLMQPAIYCISTAQMRSVEEVLKLFQSADVGRIFVVDAENHFIGALTRRDVERI